MRTWKVCSRGYSRLASRTAVWIAAAQRVASTELSNETRKASPAVLISVPPYSAIYERSRSL